MRQFAVGRACGGRLDSCRACVGPGGGSPSAPRSLGTQRHAGRRRQRRHPHAHASTTCTPRRAATITFRRDGRYDRARLEQLNWFLRDWRTRRADPDGSAPVRHRSGRSTARSAPSEPIHVVSAYRSPRTNAMLRRRSRAVAKHSQHMRGKAMDFYLPDVPIERIRAVGMRLQGGGVGYYPVRLQALRASRRRQRALLAAHDPRPARAPVPRRQDRAPAGRRQAAGRATRRPRPRSWRAAARSPATRPYREPRRRGQRRRRKSFWATLFGWRRGRGRGGDQHGPRPRDLRGAPRAAAGDHRPPGFGLRRIASRAPAEPPPVRAPVRPAPPPLPAPNPRDPGRGRGGAQAPHRRAEARPAADPLRRPPGDRRDARRPAACLAAGPGTGNLLRRRMRDREPRADAAAPAGRPRRDRRARLRADPAGAAGIGGAGRAVRRAADGSPIAGAAVATLGIAHPLPPRRPDAAPEARPTAVAAADPAALSLREPATVPQTGLGRDIGRSCATSSPPLRPPRGPRLCRRGAGRTRLLPQPRRAS